MTLFECTLTKAAVIKQIIKRGTYFLGISLWALLW